jgi:hypothetical protein
VYAALSETKKVSSKTSHDREMDTALHRTVSIQSYEEAAGDSYSDGGISTRLDKLLRQILPKQRENRASGA